MTQQSKYYIFNQIKENLYYFSSTPFCDPLEPDSLYLNHILIHTPMETLLSSLGG